LRLLSSLSGQDESNLSGGPLFWIWSTASLEWRNEKLRSSAPAQARHPVQERGSQMSQQSQAPQQRVNYSLFALGNLILFISLFVPWLRVTSAISQYPQYLSPWNLLSFQDILARSMAGYLALVTLLEAIASGVFIANPQRQLRVRLLWLSCFASVVFFCVFLEIFGRNGGISWPFYRISLEYGVGTEALGLLLVSGSLLLFRE
jgi:hypothetical protein